MEFLIVVIIILILFGGSRLPEIGRGIGETIRNFRKGSNPKEIDEKRGKEK